MRQTLASGRDGGSRGLALLPRAIRQPTRGSAEAWGEGAAQGAQGAGLCRPEPSSSGGEGAGPGCWVLGRWTEQAAGALQAPTWADREPCWQDCPDPYTLAERQKRRVQERRDTRGAPEGGRKCPTSRSSRAWRRPRQRQSPPARPAWQPTSMRQACSARAPEAPAGHGADARQSATASTSTAAGAPHSWGPAPPWEAPGTTTHAAGDPGRGPRGRRRLPRLPCTSPRVPGCLRSKIFVRRPCDVCPWTPPRPGRAQTADPPCDLAARIPSLWG